MMDRDTVNTIRDMIQHRIDELTQEWEDGEKGTNASSRRLDSIELLTELKWEILDARTAELKAQESF